MKILVIPEDQTSDGHILKPVLEAMLADAAIPGRVDILPEPRLRGASDALNPELVAEIVADNPMVDVFVLAVDRDCDRQKHSTLARAREAEHAGRLLACLALQELEVWLLALYRDELDEPSWPKIRTHCDPKERWAEPLLKKLGSNGPGGGRKRAMSALKGRYASLKSLCPEIKELQERLTALRKAS